MSSDTTLDCMFDAKPECTCSHCQANRRIEALEGEVARLNAECCRCGQPTTAVCKAARDAEARAERLFEILNEIAGYADDRPGSWAAMRARKALEDKQ